jgi:hypothetical protein
VYLHFTKVVWFIANNLSQSISNLLFRALANTLKLQLIRLIGRNFFKFLVSSSLGIRVMIA